VPVVSAVGRFRDRLVAATLGIELRQILVGYQQALERLEQRNEDIYVFTLAQLEPTRIERDGTAAAQDALAKIRSSAAYRAAFAQTEPLISVRIASYQNLSALMDIAIASVLAQTYEYFEVVVVNDGPSDETRRAVEGLHDARIRYAELPVHSTYPANSYLRWMVAGSPAMNRGAELAVGTWVAPLDQDDSFTPDHLEKLLASTLAGNSELAYGAVGLRNTVTGEQAHIWSSPPRHGHFSFQGAMHLRLLSDIFRYDESSWMVGEPGDWNLMRRMLAAGVTMTAIPDVVAIMNNVPHEHKR
jgi:Glycosyl transferase family 2